MATYRSQLITVPEPEPQGYAASLRVTERPVYGSSRLGTYARWEELYDHPVVSTPAPDPVQPVDLNYELTDHLGNVTAVVTGRLLSGNGGGTPKQAELVSAQGYEAFGSLLPGRNYNSGSTRYGFNGKENDNEVHGAVGTFQDYGMRAYDTRVAKFFSVDPIAYQYPFLTPYQFASNNPIVNIDVDGLEGYSANGGGWVTNPPSVDCQGCGPISKDRYEAIKRWYDNNRQSGTEKPQKNMLYIYNPDGWGPNGKGYYYAVKGKSQFVTSVSAEFGGGSTQLLDQEAFDNQLNYIVERLQDYPNDPIVVTGNTGTNGSVPGEVYGATNSVYDQPGTVIDGRLGTTGELMDARARVVVDALIARGVDSSRITVLRGSNEPSMSNRRIDVRVDTSSSDDED